MCSLCPPKTDTHLPPALPTPPPPPPPPLGAALSLARRKASVRVPRRVFPGQRHCAPHVRLPRNTVPALLDILSEHTRQKSNFSARSSRDLLYLGIFFFVCAARLIDDYRVTGPALLNLCKSPVFINSSLARLIDGRYKSENNRTSLAPPGEGLQPGAHCL